jgi:hypothetical protein
VTIAACAIARNSAATIERFVVSVRPHVDELCVWLGGESTDETPAILERLAAEPGSPLRVQQGEWRDYAHARNKSFEMASSDFLMWADDDEVLEGGPWLREAVMHGDSDVVFVQRVEVRRGRVAYAAQIRVVAASTSPSWTSPVHEVLQLGIPYSDWRIGAADPAHSRVIHAPVRTASRHHHRALVEASLEGGDSRRHLSLYLAHHLLRDDHDVVGAAAALEAVIENAESAQPHEVGEIAMAYKLLASLRAQLGDTAGAAEAESELEKLSAATAGEPWLEIVEKLAFLPPADATDTAWAYARDPRATTEAAFDI